MKRQNGYIALIAVLVAGAASLAIALALLVSGTDSQRSALVTQQSAKARSFAKSCVEEAMQQIRDNHSFVGTNSLNIQGGSCTYNVTDAGGGNRTIDATGVMGNVVKKVQARVIITMLSIVISLWQEV